MCKCIPLYIWFLLNSEASPFCQGVRSERTFPNFADFYRFFPHFLFLPFFLRFPPIFGKLSALRWGTLSHLTPGGYTPLPLPLILILMFKRFGPNCKRVAEFVCLFVCCCCCCWWWSFFNNNLKL